MNAILRDVGKPFKSSREAGTGLRKIRGGQKKKKWW
jgi:hypothetical protein